MSLGFYYEKNFESIGRIVLACYFSIPKIKSFDVMGLRLDGNALSIDINGTDNICGYQKYDNKTIEYGHSNKNFKYTSGKNGGLSLSSNISDDVKSSLKLSISATLYAEDNCKIYGTYQHAKSNITLKQSKDYTISSKGLGKVLLYKDSLKNKFDNTPGLVVSSSLLDY